MKYLLTALILTLVAGMVEAQTARLSWTDNAGKNCTPTQCDQEDRYLVDAAVGAATFSTIATLPANSETYDHNVSTLAAGTVLTYRVCAENTAGKTCSPGAKFTVPSQPPPPPPKQQIVVPLPAGAVGVSWVCPAGKSYDQAANACI